jgi:cytochrome oxidase Cu insertion factor (SCO1/SenC/PrrC family)
MDINIKKTFNFAVFGFITIVLILYFLNLSRIQPGLRKVSLAVTNFTLHNSAGGMFSQASFHEKKTLVFFGYPGCDGICPATLGKMLHLSQIMTGPNMQYVFVSLKTGSAGSEALRGRMKTYGNGIQGLYAENLFELRNALSPFRIQADLGHTDSENHSANIYYIDETGTIKIIFTDPTISADQILKYIQ